MDRFATPPTSIAIELDFAALQALAQARSFVDLDKEVLVKFDTLLACNVAHTLKVKAERAFVR